MSEIDTLSSVDPQQNQKKITMTLDDPMTAELVFTEEERLFIDNLNVDSELVEKKTNEPIVAEQVHYVTPDELKMYVMKCVSLQDVCDLASLEPDFYDKVEQCIDEMELNSFSRIDNFVAVRLQRIIMYCRSFSENICNKLASEEQQLYIDLCQRVNEYRKKMDERLKVEQKSSHKA